MIHVSQAGEKFSLLQLHVVMLRSSAPVICDQVQCCLSVVTIHCCKTLSMWLEFLRRSILRTKSYCFGQIFCTILHWVNWCSTIEKDLASTLEWYQLCKSFSIFKGFTICCLIVIIQWNVIYSGTIQNIFGDTLCKHIRYSWKK